MVIGEVGTGGRASGRGEAGGEVVSAGAKCELVSLDLVDARASGGRSFVLADLACCGQCDIGGGIRRNGDFC